MDEKRASHRSTGMRSAMHAAEKKSSERNVHSDSNRSYETNSSSEFDNSAYKDNSSNVSKSSFEYGSSSDVNNGSVNFGNNSYEQRKNSSTANNHSNDLLNRLERASNQDHYDSNDVYGQESFDINDSSDDTSNISGASARSNSDAKSAYSADSNGHSYKNNNAPGNRPPRKRKISKEERLRRKRKLLIKRAIALLIIVVIIVLAIVLIVNGAKGKSSKNENQTTVEETTTSGDESGETTTGDETTTETTVAETTTTSNSGDTIVKPDNWNGKTIYLTFDDGPSAVTEEILEVLDQYNVKATFFTLGYGSKETYQKLVNDGHALGVHSYSHDYDTIYASMENFQNDVTTLRDLLEEYTGQEIFLYRFPGGSNNEVHKNAGNMKMADFVDYINSIGMKYVDWNASSSDAEYVTGDVDVIYNQSAGDISYWGDETDQTTIVLLMHDAETKTTNPDVLRKLIPEFLEKGYAFDCIHKDTPDIHFELPDE